MEIGRQFPDVDWIASPESEQHLGPEKQGGGRETEIGKTSNVVSSVSRGQICHSNKKNTLRIHFFKRNWFFFALSRYS